MSCIDGGGGSEAQRGVHYEQTVRSAGGGGEIQRGVHYEQKVRDAVGGSQGKRSDGNAFGTTEDVDSPAGVSGGGGNGSGGGSECVGVNYRQTVSSDGGVSLDGDCQLSTTRPISGDGGGADLGVAGSRQPAAIDGGVDGAPTPTRSENTVGTSSTPHWATSDSSALHRQSSTDTGLLSLAAASSALHSQLGGAEATATVTATVPTSTISSTPKLYPTKLPIESSPPSFQASSSTSAGTPAAGKGERLTLYPKPLTNPKP